MTEAWEAGLGLAGLTVGLSAWLRLETHATLRGLRGEVRDARGGLSGRMEKLEGSMRDLGERVARLEGKFEPVAAYVLRRDDRPAAAPAE